jgi:hypothetical protein
MTELICAVGNVLEFVMPGARGEAYRADDLFILRVVRVTTSSSCVWCPIARTTLRSVMVIKLLIMLTTR